MHTIGDNRLLFLDLETPNARNDSISQIGIICLVNGEEAFHKSVLVNPEEEFDQRNIKMTGILPEDAESAPTFPEIWPELREYFHNCLIVGHNLRFDLSVIGKSIRRYGLEPINVEYLDTLTKAKEVYNVPKYSVDDLSAMLGYKENHHHDALDDVYACMIIYQDIDKKGLWKLRDHKIYDFSEVKYVNDGAHREILVNAINSLKDIIKDVLKQDEIGKDEKEKLGKWFLDHQLDLMKNGCFEELIIISATLHKGELSKELLTSLYGKLDNLMVSKNRKFSDETLSMRALKGLMSGIVADDKITIDEVRYLQAWLSKHKEFAGNYPFDKVITIVNSVLEDNILSQDEQDQLKQLCKEYSNPLPNEEYKCTKELNLNGKTVCLSGDFVCGTKAHVKNIIKDMGGINVDSVTKKTDVLIVGGKGNENWAYGNYGKKVQKALKMQDQGLNICIYKENDVLK